jgi:surface antigen
MKSLKIAVVALIALGLIACEGQGEKETIGTVLGAAVGAVAGAQMGKGKGRDVGIALGALLGSLAGSSIGKSLDRADMAHLNRTQQASLETKPSGATTPWQNPDSGNSGTVTPRRTYQTAQGQYCREFQQTITVGGRTEEAFGTACRQPDGTWKIKN